MGKISHLQRKLNIAKTRNVLMLKARKLRGRLELDDVTCNCKRRLGKDMLSNVTSFLNDKGQAYLTV